MSNHEARTKTLGEVRVYRHNVFAPFSQGANHEEAKYSLTVLIPKTNEAAKTAIDEAIQATANDALHTKWNGTAPVPLITPLHDGDGVRSNGEGYGADCAGCYVLTANSKEQPEIVDANLQPIINTREIYRGVWVYVSVTFFSYMRNGKKGIGCALGPVMKSRDDEALDGRVTARKAFEGVMRPAVLNDGVSAAEVFKSVSQS